MDEASYDLRHPLDVVIKLFCLRESYEANMDTFQEVIDQHVIECGELFQYEGGGALANLYKSTFHNKP